MATYFLSDVHGEYELFCKLLDEIRFCNSDAMIVLGDFIDKGSNSIKLAKLIFDAPNIRAICGNHEHAFIAYYNGLMKAFEDDCDINIVLGKLQNYFQGETERLTWDIIDYIESLPDYIEADDYICVHAGLELDNNARIIPLSKQNRNFFIFDRRFKDEGVVPQNGKTVLFGHTPCHYKNGTGHIIKTPRKDCDLSSRRIRDFAKVQLDNGVAHTNMIGCLRLEDMKEFYVRKERFSKPRI